MAIRQSPAQKRTVKRVMHEFKHGELKTARGKRKVKNRRQAVAIALSEAGASKYDSPAERRHNLRRTKTKERRGQTGQAAAEGRRTTQRRSGTRKTAAGKATTRRTTAAGRTATRRSTAAARRTTASRRNTGGKTRAELYREAQRRDIAGRSKMNKQQLERALRR